MPKHALADIPQELPDELFSQMMSAPATNHDADLGKVAADFIKNSPRLIGAIVLMGGAGGAMQTQQQFKNGTGQTQMEESGHENPGDETKQPPTAEPSIPDTTISSRIPSFDEAFAASQTIEKLKAQKTPLSLEQQQELDTAEKIFAKRTEANILAQKATLEARGEKIHPTTAAALANAQATLARPAPTTVSKQSDSELQGNSEKPAEEKKHLIGTTRESIDHKLDTYLLNPEHKVGGPKAKWFKEALGFTRDNAGRLADQLVFDPKTAVATDKNQHGQKYEQIIHIHGANGKIIPVVMVWIRNLDGVVRYVTAIPTNKKND